MATRRTANASGAGSKRTARRRTRADAAAPVEGTSADEAPAIDRRRRTHQIEQLGVLSAALLLGLFGFLLHILWFGSVVLMAVLLGQIATDFQGRRGGGAISEVVGTAVDEAREVVHHD
jgi:hypothetical protein